MDEMKPLLSIGQTVEDYFMKAMLENIQRPLSVPMPNPNLRNEAYYTSPIPIDLGSCPHCGHSLNDLEY